MIVTVKCTRWCDAPVWGPCQLLIQIQKGDAKCDVCVLNMLKEAL